MQEAYGLDSHDAVLQKTPFSFDVSVWEFFWPLLTGSRLVMARPEGHKDPAYLVDLVRRERITTMHFVPSMLQVFLEQGEVETCSTLKRVICSGEALPPELVKRFNDRLLATELHNLYGPTEAAVDVTAWHCAPGAIPASIPIGHPIANTRMYVLDAHGQPVPVGVIGELYIGGVQVARGYLNRPELTAERFVADPFSRKPNARMYKTGDLGRWLPDGNIEFLGRNDFQVKLRGFRIELGEIEARLLEHPEVREAVVIAREDEPGDKRLVAYFVSSDELGAEDIADPSLEPPAGVHGPGGLRATGCTATDTQRQAGPQGLAGPDVDAYATHVYEAPQGEIETTLAAIWSELLKVERVGRHDNFFELGGHSLLAVTLVERMRRQGLQVDVRALFTSPTLAGLAMSAGGGIREVAVPPNLIPANCTVLTPEMLPLVDLTPAEIERIVATVPGGVANIQDIYPLAPLQEGILFHHLMAAEGDAYLLPTLFAFDTRKRLDGFIGAMQAVVDRHDILRTAVIWENIAEPVQVVWRKALLPVEEAALDPGLDAATQLREIFDPRHHRIDLHQAPLLHLHLARDTAKDRWLLLIFLHHLVSDHTTLGVMTEEIQAHLLGQTDQLPKPIPYRNLVAQARLGMSREEHEIFFRRMLGDVDEPTAPFGLLDVQGDGSGIREAHLEVDLALSKRLRERARQLGVSAASLYHQAWAQVLARLTGREDVVFGTVLFGRMQGGEGADRGMGLFINTLPVKLRAGKEGAEASVRRTQLLLAELMHHEHASLALAQRCSAVPAPAPLFTTLLNYRHSGGSSQQPSAEAERAWEGVELLYGEERTNYPLTLSVDDLGVGFTLTVQVHTSIEPMRICEFMHTALERLVSALEIAPETPIRNLDVMPETERRLVVETWNATEAAFPSDRVHPRVVRSPGRPTRQRLWRWSAKTNP